MAARYIIPIEPASGRGDTVVVEVQQEGTQALDLRLVGCEGESPYVTTIKQRNLGKLKHKFKGSDGEWATVLARFLLQKQPESDQEGLLEGVRMVYAIKNDNLELSVRQDVQGIKVTLGEIILPRDEEFEFNPFDWAQASARAHATTLQEMTDLKSRLSREQDTITKLNAQLEDFIKTKNEAETAMLQQFMELLNEKKRKIRDQSRLLAGAKVDKTTASAVQSSRTSSKARKAGPSRTSKRKAPAQKAEPDLEPDSDIDQMEIDQAKSEEQDDDEVPEPTTPDRSDDETEAEEEDVALPTRAKSSETARSASVAKGSKDDAPESEGVPPPRSLPFGRPATRSKEAESKHSKHDGDEDDETDEEEL
ncbi:Nn.00g074580.m01.CDS01 [Neocucurbitaria sp. VM-36]